MTHLKKLYKLDYCMAELKVPLKNNTCHKAYIFFFKKCLTFHSFMWGKSSASYFHLLSKCLPMEGICETILFLVC